MPPLSQREVDLFRAVANGKPLAVVPNGVNIDDFRFTGQHERPSSEVLFVGNFCHYANVDAIQFLCTEVLPKLRQRLSSLRLTVAGSHPPDIVRQLGTRPDVRVVGTVPDLRPYLARAGVLVCPLRAGSGTRIRILEAMASGIPVISTTVGCEGLEVQPGKHVLVADGSHAIAEATLELISNRHRAKSLAEEARHLVETRYQWAQSASSLQHLYERTRLTKEQSTGKIPQRHPDR